jgi:hypothetical protein
MSPGYKLLDLQRSNKEATHWQAEESLRVWWSQSVSTVSRQPSYVPTDDSRRRAAYAAGSRQDDSSPCVQVFPLNAMRESGRSLALRVTNGACSNDKPTHGSIRRLRRSWHVRTAGLSRRTLKHMAVAKESGPSRGTSLRPQSERLVTVLSRLPANCSAR